MDASTKKPLSFATVTSSKTNGTLSDISGLFTIKESRPFTNITVSYVGYKTQTIQIKKSSFFYTVYLQPKTEQLNEIVIRANFNKANKIISKAIQNKPKNNIETALNSFEYAAYNKIIVTANPDSISNKIDSIFVINKGQKSFKKLDSTNYKFYQEIKGKHLYLAEKISEFEFEKGKEKREKILASRMAGLKQPIYELIALKLQDFSFYNKVYSLAGNQYISPLAKKALTVYNYKILDTVNNAIGKSYVVKFEQKKINSKNAGIEGVLYIDTENYALTQAIAELKGIIQVKATQYFKYFKNKNIWFPVKQNLLIKKGNQQKNIKLFGGNIQFENPKKNDSIVRSSKTSPSNLTYFKSSSSNFNIKLNTPIKIHISSPKIQFSSASKKQTQTYWEKFRKEDFTKRDQVTYSKLDSIAKTQNVEHKINLARQILKGFYPTRYFNFNLGKIINLNNYEGLRIGIGGETNQNFSNFFKLKSYVAFGTKDRDFKYSFGTDFKLNSVKNTWLGINYTNDLKEAASLNFIEENTSFSPINPRNLNISKFYNYKTFDINLTHDFLPNLSTHFQLSTGDYTPVFNYQFQSTNKLLSKYQLSLATIGLQYNPNSNYMSTPIGKIRISDGYPKITFQIVKSFENVFKSDFNFTQINFRILENIKPLNKTAFKILFEGGIVFGDAPISHLYNATPNYTFKNPWLRRVTFAGKNSFETMGYNEFISDRFLAIHIKKLLKPIKIFKGFKPQFTLVTRSAIGNLKNPSYQHGLNFKTLNKGYFESGIELNKLYKGFGLSAHYRYGAYTNPTWSDNLAVKLTYKFSLGI